MAIAMKGLSLMITKKYRSIDQAKLKILSDIVCDNLEDLLEHFHIEYKNAGRMISMCCPIHGGDNPSAINIYPEGDSYRGNWKCRTHGCEEHFKSSIIGFFRGVLSHEKLQWSKEGDYMVSFEDAVNFLSDFVKKDLKDIRISNSDRDKRMFTSLMNYVQEKNRTESSKITRQHVLSSLKIPAPYFLGRGYSEQILSKYDIGLCDNPNKPMYQRIVVPVYDIDYKYLIGSSGRSIFEKCLKCGAFHDTNKKCPPKEESWKYSKWKHSANFKSQNSLYNFWFAKKTILETGIAIIVESPGNVWRLEENGIHNSVAIFGASMTDRQKVLLDSSGAMTLIVLTDNDEAGRKAAEQIKQKCQNTYKVYVPTISKGDVGEMNSDEINDQIKPLLEKIV
jgi:5S rRNA maturation endonuclease (ribonuclease M5)